MDDDSQERIAQINEILARPTGRRAEAEVLHLLRDAAALDAVLSGVDLDRLIDALDDHTLGPKHREQVIELLTRTRIAELSTATRAALVSAFSRGKTPKQQEQGIHDVLLATHGQQLTALKNLLDRGSDYHDFAHIMYVDIDDHELRKSALAHLQREAEALSPSPRPLKILSDIDDTLYANWTDERFPKKTVYPGVRQLYRELDRGVGEQPEGSGDLVFVTARPGDRPGIIEGLTHARLRDLGIESATILTGSVLSVLGDAVIAAGKLLNFRKYAALFGEYDFVFIGDSGQGDADFGAVMREGDPVHVRAVWIHDVTETNGSTRAQWAARGVEFFRTYVGAALLAEQRGLIQAAGVERVIAAARADFATIAFTDAAQRQARLAELEADIARRRG